MEKIAINEVLTPSININTDIVYANTSVEDELFITDSVNQLHYNISGILQAYYTTTKTEDDITTIYNYGNLPFVTPKDNIFLPTPARTVRIGGDFCILVQYYYIGPLYNRDKVDFAEFTPKLLFYSKSFAPEDEEAFEAWKRQKKEEFGESMEFYALNNSDQSNIYNYNYDEENNIIIFNLDLTLDNLGYFPDYAATGGEHYIKIDILDNIYSNANTYDTTLKFWKVPITGQNYYSATDHISVVSPTYSWGENNFSVNTPLYCQAKEGWYSKGSCGINLNNNDIIKVNGIMFNEDNIDNSGEGIQFYHSSEDSALLPFDIFYGSKGKLYFMSNPRKSSKLLFNQKYQLCYGVGDTITLPSKLPLQGYITDSCRNIEFLIPLTIPILNYNDIELSGTIQIRGDQGYLAHPLRGNDKETTAFNDITTIFELNAGNSNGLVTHSDPYLEPEKKENDDTDQRIDTLLWGGKSYTCGIPSDCLSYFVTPAGIVVNIKMNQDQAFKHVTNNTTVSITPVSSIYTYYNETNDTPPSSISEKNITKWKTDPLVSKLQIKII